MTKKHLRMNHEEFVRMRRVFKGQAGVTKGKQGSGLLLLHLMFMLFLILSRNIIIENLSPYAVEM